jgi:hypothetical protein
MARARFQCPSSINFSGPLDAQSAVAAAKARSPADFPILSESTGAA